jgi:hypothetical protein
MTDSRMSSKAYDDVHNLSHMMYNNLFQEQRRLPLCDHWPRAAPPAISQPPVPVFRLQELIQLHACLQMHALTL